MKLSRIQKKARHKQQKKLQHVPQSANQPHTGSHMQNAMPEHLTPENILQLQALHGNQFVLQLTRQNQSQVTSKTEKQSPIIQRLGLDLSNAYDEYPMKFYVEDNARAVAKEKNGTRVEDPKAAKKYKAMVKPLLSKYKKLKSMWAKYQSYTDSTIADAKTLVEAQKKLGKLSVKTYQLADALIEYSDKVQTYNIKDQFMQPAIKQTLKMAQEISDVITVEGDVIHNLDPNYLTGDTSLTLSQVVVAVRSGVNLDQIINADEGKNQRELGGGQISKPVAMEFGDGVDEQSRVFKINEVGAETPGKIDDNNVQTTIRLMAASRFDQLIQQRLAEANQEYQSMLGNYDVAVLDGQIGTLQDFAQGREGKKANSDGTSDFTNFDLNEGELQRQLANLQLFDMITGQLDRHLGNLMIDQGEDRATRVTGIDTDFAFSGDVDVNDVIGKSAMPEFIDYYFANTILNISVDEFSQLLTGLDPSDIDAAVTRFVETQAILEQKRDNAELVRAPGDDDLSHGDRAWGEIAPDEYRIALRASDKGDYVGDLYRKQQLAINATVQVIKDGGDPTPIPYKDRFAIPYIHEGDQYYMTSRSDDGSDLEELIQQAYAIIASEQGEDLPDATNELTNEAVPEQNNVDEPENESLVIDLGDMSDIEEVGFTLRRNLLAEHRRR